MTTNYIPRSLEPVLRRAAAEFPAVVLTGPRQAGKTTLLRQVFGGTFSYVSLEAPDTSLAAREDPRGFLAFHPPPVIFDEVQYAPDLLRYVKERIDDERDRAGQYILTGSQNLLLLERVTESLAGRAAILRLMPLSRREFDGQPGAPLPWEGPPPDTPPGAGKWTGPELWRRLIRGSFPELIAQPERDAALWHASYVTAYLERDLRNLRQVGDLGQFQSFLVALAARSGQLLNQADLSRDLGVAANTIKAWLSVLETSHQIILLRPYFTNLGKRLVKTPKVYFTDVGTLCHLTGVSDPILAAQGPLAGAIFETAVVAEIYKTMLHRGCEPPLHFWRTATGVEVDLLVGREGRLVPLELKAAATPKPRMAAGLRALRQDLGEQILPGYVVTAGDTALPLGQGDVALPYGRL